MWYNNKEQKKLISLFCLSNSFKFNFAHLILSKLSLELLIFRLINDLQPVLENQQSFDSNLKRSQVPEAPTHLSGCNKQQKSLVHIVYFLNLIFPYIFKKIGFAYK